MKSLKLSSITALLFFSFFSSCKKDSSTVSPDGTDQSASNLVNARAGGGGNSSAADNVDPSLIVTFNPDPGVINQTETVTGTFDATTGVAIPDCGKLQLFQKVDGNWVKVADADVSSLIHQVSYVFTPTVAGDDAYEFRLHYIKSGGCDGFNTFMSGSFFLDVQNQCVSQFTIIPSVSAQNIGGGRYEFSISYTLISPVDVSGIKFQGGATAGGNVGHEVTDLGNTVVVNANNNNTVLKWEGDLRACTPQVIHFKFARNFSCPATDELITGAWSASAGGATLGYIDKLPYSCQ
ncbi:MAG: hypothetical protein E6H06_17270 [Bacteroidetes bacterium]|nr:MAG: hypothetical protein E6H06_17270 [Bacteroidota bacterium]